MALQKKLEELSTLCKDFKASIKMPKPKLPKPPEPVKAKNPAPKSQKDPVKMAEQIQNPDLKPKVMDAAKQHKETMKISKRGQWKIV